MMQGRAYLYAAVFQDKAKFALVGILEGLLVCAAGGAGRHYCHIRAIIPQVQEPLCADLVPLKTLHSCQRRNNISMPSIHVTCIAEKCRAKALVLLDTASLASLVKSLLVGWAGTCSKSLSSALF